MHQFITNNIRMYLLVLFIISDLFISSCKHKVIEQNKKLVIKAERSVIKQNEPLEIEINFISLKDTFNIYRHPSFGIAPVIGSEDWIRFEIYNNKGNLVHNYSSLYPNPKRPYKSDFISVYPKNPYKEIVKIYQIESNNLIKWEKKGRYKIKVIYEYKYNKKWEYGKELWEGRLESNVISVDIE